MSVNVEKYQEITAALSAKKVTLVAVSKTKPVEDILELYNLGQRDFGENYVQELVEKYEQLPKDIRWHFIGHLQSNKVRFIAPFVSLIHSIDSNKLLKEVNKEAKKNNRTIDCLLEVFISGEETKFGLDEAEAGELLQALQDRNDPDLPNNITIKGLMGMASFTTDQAKIKAEFASLNRFYNKYASLSSLHIQFSILSMGMSADYEIAVEEGSNMVRIGSLLFGERQKNK